MMMCLFKGLQGKRANHAGRNVSPHSADKIRRIRLLIRKETTGWGEPGINVVSLLTGDHIIQLVC